MEYVEPYIRCAIRVCFNLRTRFGPLDRFALRGDNPVMTILKGLKAVGEHAGIPVDVLTYDLRHYFPMAMLANGADLTAASKLVGTWR